MVIVAGLYRSIARGPLNSFVAGSEFGEKELGGIEGPEEVQQEALKDVGRNRGAGRSAAGEVEESWEKLRGRKECSRGS